MLSESFIAAVFATNVDTTLKGESSIIYFGLAIWKSIPTELKKTISYQIFKWKIKEMRPTNFHVDYAKPT